MDPLIDAAAQALLSGDPLAALNCVALRDDPAALALRGIALAQLGDLPRARDLLRRAARSFGATDRVSRARCILAEAEISLVLRDLGRPLERLGAVRAVLAAAGDMRNAAHAGCLEARRLLLTGRLGEAEHVLQTVEVNALTPAARVGHHLVVAGLAMRRIRTAPALAALDRAERAAQAAAIPALVAEVARVRDAFEAPAARMTDGRDDRLLRLEEVEALLRPEVLVVDACRSQVRRGEQVIPLASRPVLFALLRALAEAWPDDVPREALLLRALGARQADESHRARLRVEIGRLREVIAQEATLQATERGFVLRPLGAAAIIVLSPPEEGAHGDVLALLADGEAWSSSALALALDISPRTVQRALESLSATGAVESFGRGRACRWIAAGVPGFPTSLLLPVMDRDR